MCIFHKLVELVSLIPRLYIYITISALSLSITKFLHKNNAQDQRHLFVLYNMTEQTFFFFISIKAG